MATPVTTALGVTTPQAAHHVLFVSEGLGVQPGSFTTSLIETMFRADPINLARLGQGFPDEAIAVDLYKNHTGGREALLELAAL